MRPSTNERYETNNWNQRSGSRDGPVNTTPSIGLLELTWHPQNLRELCRIVDVQSNDVTVFTSKEIYERWLSEARIDSSSYDWILQGEDETLRSYFERIKAICTEAIDFLMVLTPFGSGIVTSHFVEFDPDCVTVCWLYNSQACIESTHSATEARDDLREVTPRLRRALVEEDPDTAERSLKPHRYYMRPYILEHYDGFVVEYPPIRNHLEDNWEWTKPVYCFSPYVYHSSDTDDVDRESDTGIVEITVSGRVVENVRDYDAILDVFEEVFSEHGDEVALSVLGRPVGDYGDRIMERCRALEADEYQVTYYPNTDWVPADEFDRVLERSDVLLNPIYLTEETTREPAPDEVRGTTKGTGVLFDALKYGKPLILPEGFTIAPMIEGSTVTYDTPEELRRTIEQLSADRKALDTLNAAAEENASAYTTDKQRKRFNALIRDVISSR